MPFPVGKNKKIKGMIKDEPGRKIMTELVALGPKMNVHRKIDKKLEDKLCKGT